MIFAATVATAKTVYYPKAACAEILSAEYSTGEGGSMFHQFEILCKDSNNNYTAFMVSWGSISGALGFGRMSAETMIKLVPYDGTTLKAK